MVTRQKGKYRLFLLPVDLVRLTVVAIRHTNDCNNFSRKTSYLLSLAPCSPSIQVVTRKISPGVSVEDGCMRAKHVNKTVPFYLLQEVSFMDGGGGYRVWITTK